MAPYRPTWYVSSMIICSPSHIRHQYRPQDAPWFRLGHGIVLAYIAIGWICSAVFTIQLKLENDRRDRGERDEVIGCGDRLEQEIVVKAAKNGKYESIEAARVDKGDEWSGFRYTY